MSRNLFTQKHKKLWIPLLISICIGAFFGLISNQPNFKSLFNTSVNSSASEDINEKYEKKIKSEIEEARKESLSLKYPTFNRKTNFLMGKEDSDTQHSNIPDEMRDISSRNWSMQKTPAHILSLPKDKVGLNITEEEEKELNYSWHEFNSYTSNIHNYKNTNYFKNKTVEIDDKIIKFELKNVLFDLEEKKGLLINANSVILSFEKKFNILDVKKAHPLITEQKNANPLEIKNFYFSFIAYNQEKKDILLFNKILLPKQSSTRIEFKINLAHISQDANIISFVNPKILLRYKIVWLLNSVNNNETISIIAKTKQTSEKDLQLLKIDKYYKLKKINFFFHNNSKWLNNWIFIKSAFHQPMVSTSLDEFYKSTNDIVKTITPEIIENDVNFNLLYYLPYVEWLKIKDVKTALTLLTKTTYDTNGAKTCLIKSFWKNKVARDYLLKKQKKSWSIKYPGLHESVSSIFEAIDKDNDKLKITAEEITAFLKNLLEKFENFENFNSELIWEEKPTIQYETSTATPLVSYKVKGKYRFPQKFILNFKGNFTDEITGATTEFNFSKIFPELLHKLIPVGYRKYFTNQLKKLFEFENIEIDTNNSIEITIDTKNSPVYFKESLFLFNNQIPSLIKMGWTSINTNISYDFSGLKPFIRKFFKILDQVTPTQITLPTISSFLSAMRTEPIYTFIGLLKTLIKKEAQEDPAIIQFIINLICKKMVSENNQWFFCFSDLFYKKSSKFGNHDFFKSTTINNETTIKNNPDVSFYELESFDLNDNIKDKKLLNLKMKNKAYENKFKYSPLFSPEFLQVSRISHVEIREFLQDEKIKDWNKNDFISDTKLEAILAEFNKGFINNFYLKRIGQFNVEPKISVFEFDFQGALDFILNKQLNENFLLSTGLSYIGNGSINIAISFREVFKRNFIIYFINPGIPMIFKHYFGQNQGSWREFSTVDVKIMPQINFEALERLTKKP